LFRKVIWFVDMVNGVRRS